MNTIFEYLYNLIPPDRKTKSLNEISFNCPCCYHTEQPDKKKKKEGV